MTTRHGQNEVPVVERLEDRLLFSAGLTAATCPEAYVEKPCGHAEAFMEKPCVAAGLAGGDGCGGFSNVAIGREGKLLTHPNDDSWSGSWPGMRASRADSLVSHGLHSGLPGTGYCEKPAGHDVLDSDTAGLSSRGTWIRPFYRRSCPSEALPR